MADVRVVFDTNVVIDHIRAEDNDCSSALVALKASRHILVTCESLLREYRGVLCKGDSSMYSVVDRFLAQMLPIDQMDKQSNPTVKISFGPVEDRYHMRLAIDSGARFHVTKDRLILAEMGNMRRFNVSETPPRSYAIQCSRNAKR